MNVKSEYLYFSFKYSRSQLIRFFLNEVLFIEVYSNLLFNTIKNCKIFTKRINLEIVNTIQEQIAKIIFTIEDLKILMLIFKDL